MPNPKVKTIPSALDFLIEAIAILLILISFALPFIYSNKLQGEIPTHYNLLGVPDKWSQQKAIWLYPGIGLVIFVLFPVLNKYPFLYRYPVKVTQFNAQYLYSLSTRTVRILKLLVAALILCFAFEGIEIGVGQKYGIAKYCIPVFLLSSVLLFCVVIFKMRSNKNLINTSN
jgi:Protein of unknown function (DUF1648)